MNLKNVLTRAASLLAWIAPVARAQLPYNPTRILGDSHGGFAYVFAPDASSSQFSLALLNTSDTIEAPYSASTLSPTLPFLTQESTAFTPILGDGGDITVLTGTCRNGAHGLELWRYADGSWTDLQLTLVDASLSADFLAAGFPFSPTGSAQDASLYVFGGMCPQTAAPTSADWTQEATYSNTMLTLAPEANAPSNGSGTVPYDLSMTGQRSPPIAEAGLTITPLMPISSTTSAGSVSQQQNFVLIGGHTQDAFINMSQVALFSLPEQSWAFLAIDPPAGSGSSTELFSRSGDTVEPRSGHTAVMTPDGSRIVVFGGWVGDIGTPAEPQLAILEVGQEYGGTGNWAWTIPAQVSSPFASGQGIYGHGATMLPGGVMMVTGGYKIAGSASKHKRDLSEKTLFFNTTASSWISSYTNPSSPNSSTSVGGAAHSSHGLQTTSQKAGLGVGLALALAAVAGLLIFGILHRRRVRQRRLIRERELRELALGAERYHSASLVAGGVDGRGGYPEMRTASWGSRQERSIENPGELYPWAPVTNDDRAGPIGLGIADDPDGNGMRHADRTGVLMDLPSPTRGLRRSLHSRGPTGYGANFGPYLGAAPPVFRIDEEEEGSQTGSLSRARTPARIVSAREAAPSDPFKDPVAAAPVAEARPPTAAEERKREVAGWVEDWSAAAESMTISRNPSKATTQGRTYSTLSNSQAQSHSGSSQSGRSGSPDKSDRTGSNLSERSMISNYSIQRSQTGTLSRQISVRSASTGYALFAGAAAAMAARMRGETGSRQPEYGTVGSGHGSLARAPSKRSTSLTFNSTASSQVPETSPTRGRAETFSSARTSVGPIRPGEDHALMRDEKDHWATPPESPVRQYPRTDGFGAGRKALGVLGSVRRIFTGTGGVDVQDRVAALEGRSGQSSPTKHTQPPEMSEGPRRAVSAGAATAFWRGKRGARDWDDDGHEKHDAGPVAGSSAANRQSVPASSVTAGDDDSDIDDWDVETAVQKRVVQVMFTVPKEKLRVVNADALSLMSKSDVDFDGGENEPGESAKEVKRMSSVRESDEPVAESQQGQGKGKEREVTVVNEKMRYVFED